MTGEDRRLPPLATLEPFEAAFRHRNFTRAGEELHMSQASVSRRVRELEADLGLSLFERNRYDVTPTADAELLVAAVRPALREVSSTAALLRERALGTTSLTIFSDLSLSSALVAPLVGTYQRRYPDLKIRVLSSFEDIESTTEEFDIGLQYGRQEGSSHLVETIADEAVFPVCSPSFAADLEAPVSVGDLAELPLLHVDYGNVSWATWSSFFTSFDVDVAADRHMTFTSYLVSLDVAEKGEGVALGWERTVQHRIDIGTLVRIPGITMEKGGVLNAYLPKRTTPNPHTAEFLDLLKSHVASDL